ncbi:MAG: DUF3800 domain-containing protein [Candidatus Moraniibacteriota bacterium]
MFNDIKKPKRDFIFLDESGDPGNFTDYYITGLIHVTDLSLKKLNIHLGALRYFGGVRNELKSTSLNQLQKEHLLDVLKISMHDGNFVKASAVFVNKKNYKGNYLEDNELYKKDPIKFRHFVLRRLLEFHFSKEKAQSREIELVVDRFHSDESKEQQLRNYLRDIRITTLPEFIHIIQADSRYVEMLQIADWISGSVKEKFFVHKERNFNDLFSYIKVDEIVK